MIYRIFFNACKLNQECVHENRFHFDLECNPKKDYYYILDFLKKKYKHIRLLYCSRIGFRELIRISTPDDPRQPVGLRNSTVIQTGDNYIIERTKYINRCGFIGSIEQLKTVFYSKKRKIKMHHSDDYPSITIFDTFNGVGYVKYKAWRYLDTKNNTIKFHRLDGPAEILYNAAGEATIIHYFIDGEAIDASSDEEFKKIVKMLAFK